MITTMSMIMTTATITGPMGTDPAGHSLGPDLVEPLGI